MENNQQIDLKAIDWSNLNVEDFSKLEERLSERDQIIKASKERKPRISNTNVSIKLRNKFYNIPQVLATRLTELKSEKSKQKLIDEIILQYSELEEL